MKKILGLIIILSLILGFSYFIFNTGKNVEAKWTENDFNSGIEKSKIIISDIEEINIENLVRGNFSTKGSNKIDDFFTDKELSALASKANDISGPIKDIKISLNENGSGEISFMLSENFIEFLRNENILLGLNSNREVSASENQGNFNNNFEKPSITDKIISYVSNLVNKKPVYGTGKLFKDSDSLIKIKIDSLMVGRVSVPQEIINKVEFETVRILNLIISKENGFHVEELEIRDGGLYYKGTLPAEIHGKKI
jgi:hypothetical protein